MREPISIGTKDLAKLGTEKARDAEPRGDACVVCRSTGATLAVSFKPDRGPALIDSNTLGPAAVEVASVPDDPKSSRCAGPSDLQWRAKRPVMSPILCPSDVVTLIRLVECVHCAETQIACVACSCLRSTHVTQHSTGHLTTRLIRKWCQAGSWVTKTHTKSPPAILMR